MSDLDYRSWGETQNCKGCRFWSEMLAESRGNGLQAMCIAGPDSPHSGKYTSGHRTCDAWQEGSLRAAGFVIDAYLPARKSSAEHSVKLKDKRNPKGNGGVARIRWVRKLGEAA